MLLPINARVASNVWNPLLISRTFSSPKPLYFKEGTSARVRRSNDSICGGVVSAKKKWDTDLDSDSDSELPFLLRMEKLCSKGYSGAGALVEHLKQFGVIKSKKVADIMQKVDRGLFVPDGNSKYLDSPMPIGYNATISAPHMHATCLELLKENLQPGMRALDVGSGTGYLTACFAMMVGPQGHAVGVEHIPELVSMSVENVNKSEAASLLSNGSLSFHVGDGRQGWPALAPYDAIHVGAAAREIPKPLIEQLKPGGRMVVPVGDVFQDLQVIDKQHDGTLKVHIETSVRYVPLTSRENQLGNY